MAHEELRKQYEWDEGCEYRRNEPPFTPEYFSGLNWRDAEKLVGRKIEVSNDGDEWAGPFTLKGVSIDPVISHFELHSGRWTYIRTCPQTYTHRTITIRGVGLPMPETEAPKYNQPYFIFACNEKNRTLMHTWCDDASDKMWLNHGIVHLTESRATAWADWWADTVMAAIKENK